MLTWSSPLLFHQNIILCLFSKIWTLPDPAHSQSRSAWIQMKHLDASEQQKPPIWLSLKQWTHAKNIKVFLSCILFPRIQDDLHDVVTIRFIKKLKDHVLPKGFAQEIQKPKSFIIFFHSIDAPLELTTRWQSVEQPLGQGSELLNCLLTVEAMPQNIHVQCGIARKRKENYNQWGWDREKAAFVVVIHKCHKEVRDLE